MSHSYAVGGYHMLVGQPESHIGCYYTACSNSYPACYNDGVIGCTSSSV